MKKLLFIFALMCGAMFTSCGNSTKVADSVTDSIDSVVVDTLVQDTTALDTMQF